MLEYHDILAENDGEKLYIYSPYAMILRHTLKAEHGEDAEYTGENEKNVWQYHINSIMKFTTKYMEYTEREPTINEDFLAPLLILEIGQKN